MTEEEKRNLVELNNIVHDSRWITLRCRSCNKKITCRSINHYNIPQLGYKMSNKYHKHCTDLKDKEQTFCDVIKDRGDIGPEEDAVDIIDCVAVWEPDGCGHYKYKGTKHLNREDIEEIMKESEYEYLVL